MLTGGVSPGFVVRWKDAHVTTAYKLLVLHAQQWVGGVEKLRVKHDLYNHIAVP